MKKTGIINRISEKEDGRNAFTLKDDPKKWYNGFLLEAKKGDEVEFETTGNEPFNNYSKLKVLSGTEETPSSPRPPSPPSPQTTGRIGNDKIATDLTCAIIDQKHENIVTPEHAVSIFTATLSALNEQYKQ